MPISAETLLTHNYPLSLARCPNKENETFDGACPCAVIEGENFHVETHCWRQSPCPEGCQYSGIHISGSLPKDELQKIAEHIRDNNGWTMSKNWNIVILPNAL
jgi:hypothetical protein